jgi:hypothetical protein
MNTTSTTQHNRTQQPTTSSIIRSRYLPAAAPEQYVPWGTQGAGGAAKQAEWVKFLTANNLKPADFERTSWAQVEPKSDRWPQPTSTAAKKRFYWSARFSSYSSASAFARATARVIFNPQVAGFTYCMCLASPFAVPSVSPALALSFDDSHLLLLCKECKAPSPCCDNRFVVFLNVLQLCHL